MAPVQYLVTGEPVGSAATNLCGGEDVRRMIWNAGTGNLVTLDLTPAVANELVGRGALQVWTGPPPGPVTGTGASPAQVVPMQMAVTKEAPVNPAHPDFAGGADMTGFAPSDAQFAAAIAYAATAGATGTTAEMYIPSGKLVLSARAQMGAIQRLRIFGDGSTSFIQQQTNNEPIFEWAAGSNTIVGTMIERLRLEHLNQQTAAAQPNAAAIRLLSTNLNGVYYNVFRDLMVNQSARFLQYGDGSATLGFWNNTISNVFCNNIGGALIRNASLAAAGSPTNWVVRLTHSGTGGGTPTEPALVLGGATQWDFASLDIEDWTDTVLTMTGAGRVDIRGLHLERHHLVTANASVFSVGGSNCVFNLDGASNSFLIDGAGPAFYFANYTTGFGRVANIISNKAAGSAGAGQLRLVNANAASAVELGPRVNTDAQIVDFLPSVCPAPWLKSDCGLPPTMLSTTALPTASATYRGAILNVKGATGTVLDRLVICRQDAAGAYAWVDLF